MYVANEPWLVYFCISVSIFSSILLSQGFGFLIIPPPHRHSYLYRQKDTANIATMIRASSQVLIGSFHRPSFLTLASTLSSLTDNVSGDNNFNNKNNNKQQAKYGVSFSPAGLLTPFHIGASTCLNDLGCLTPDVALAGSSGGALAAVTSALLTDYPEGTLPISPLEASVYVASQCRDFGVRGTLRRALDEMLLKLIPDDAHHKLNSRPGCVKIAFTAISSTIGIQGRFIDNFQDKEDVMACLRASCNIPFYFNGNSLFVKVRNENAVDGFFSVDFRRFGCPPTDCTDRELIICPFAPPFINIQPYLLRPESSQCEYDIITPELLDKEHWPFSRAEIMRMALDAPASSLNTSSPISDAEIREKYGVLFRAGYESVRRWYEIKGKSVWKLDAIRKSAAEDSKESFSSKESENVFFQ